MDGGPTPTPTPPAGKNFADMNNDEVVQFLFVVWKQFGAIYMNTHIHETKGKIMGLKQKCFVDYFLLILEFCDQTLVGLRGSIKDTNKNPVTSYNPRRVDGRAHEPSLAAFIGLGDESTNPGINNKVNNAAGTGRVVNFTPTPPVTPIISSGFGFGTAASTTAPAAAANEKAAPPAAAANKTSAPPVANMPVPIVSLKPAAKPTVQSSASSASESALRSVVNTPNKSTTRINARSSRKKGANLLRSTIGSARCNGGLSSKQLFEDTENIIPATIGGEDDDNTCNFLSGLFQEFFTEAVEEVSLMGFS